MTRSRESGNTTQSPSGTRSDGEELGVLAIRWAFPLPNSLVTVASGDPLVLGRNADCDVVLPGAEISRKHAKLFQRGPLWAVQDLESRNGVYLNGKRVDVESLSIGDVLRVGEWIGVVRLLTRTRAGGQLDAEVPFSELTPGLFGSTVLARVLADARKAARSDLRVVVQGATGTGKERVAQAIHAWSGRNGHFVAINCAALPEPLAEGELFGYRKGAFTGADRANLGHLRAADGGTLLLDEITDLSLSVQAKLLRALEQRAVVPLGESLPVPIDVRIIAAAQEPLSSAVEQGRFRPDLWARLDGLTIVLPRLRDRSEDVPGLFGSMSQAIRTSPNQSVDPRFIERLCLYDWPGNVREVEQLARQLAVLRNGESVLRRSHLPERMLVDKDVSSRRDPPEEPGSVLSDDEIRRQEDLRSLLQALRLHRGNVALAARELGISRQKAYRRLEALPDRVLQEFRSPNHPTK